MRSLVLLFSFFWLYSAVESSAFYWVGRIDSNWWTNGNWRCNCTGYIPTASDDVFISDENISRPDIIVNKLAQCQSLSLQGSVKLAIVSDLVVGKGGLRSSDQSIITLTQNLTSFGDVNIMGVFFWKSGIIDGPGDYTFNTIQASVCLIYAHVTVQTMTIEPSLTDLIDIQIYPNSWLNVTGEIKSVTGVPLTINGNITANSLTISGKITLGGNVTQNYITLITQNGILEVYTPIVVQTMVITNQMLVYSSNAKITSAVGQGQIFIYPGAHVQFEKGPLVKVTTAGNVTLDEGGSDIVNVTGGFLYTTRTQSPCDIKNLYVSGATLDGNAVVCNLVLGEESILLGNIEVTTNVHVSGILHHAGSLILTNGSGVFENTQIIPVADKGIGSIINEKQWKINGKFESNAIIRGKGTWIVTGTWKVQGPCTITGSITLSADSILQIDNTNNIYTFGDISGGSINGTGPGNFTANTVSVNSFYASSGALNITNLTSKNVTSECCLPKEIFNLDVANLTLKNGNYNFLIHQLTSKNPYIMLNSGVALKIEGDVNIDTIDFKGGSLESVFVMNAYRVNMIGSDQKRLHKQSLSATILDWSNCIGNCGMVQWKLIQSDNCLCDCSQCRTTNSCTPCSSDDDCATCKQNDDCPC